MIIAHEAARLLTAAFMTITGMGEPAREYINNSETHQSYFLSHDGDCAALGLPTHDIEVAVTWNDESQQAYAHFTWNQDYVRRDILPMPGGQGCIKVTHRVSEIFILQRGELFRESSEQEYGKDAVADAGYAIKALHRQHDLDM